MTSSRASHKPRIEDDDIWVVVHSGAANIVLETEKNIEVDKHHSRQSQVFKTQYSVRTVLTTTETAEPLQYHRTNDTSTDPCSNSEMCLHDNTVTVIFLRGRLHAAM